MYKNKNKKIFAGTILGIMLFSNISFLMMPKKADAVFGIGDFNFDWITEFFSGSTSVTGGATATSTAAGAASSSTIAGLKFKELAKDILAEIAKGIAKRILAQITEDTVNWINNGFEGKPLFLENPDAFYMDIRDQEIIGFTDAIGYDKLNFPYARGFLLGYIQSQKNQFSSWAQSSLNRSLADRGKTLTDFAGDFNVGGWDGWLQLTQVPQNNPWGFQIEATEDISRRVGGLVQTKAQSIKKEIDLGSGFMSPKICVDPGPLPLGYAKKARDSQDKINKAVSKSTGAVITSGTGVTMSGGVTMTGSGGTISSNDPEVIALQQTIDANTCKRYEATTPGTVVASQITLALGSKVRQSELGAALGNSLSAVFDALINKLVDTAAGGLTSLVTNGTPEEEQGNWSYFGETLSVGGVDTTGVPSDWSKTADIPIVLSVFKENVKKAIKNTQTEISTYQSGNTNDPGIIELLNETPNKAQLIDQCMPGPNLGWEKRLEEEKENHIQAIMQNTDPDAEDSDDSDGLRNSKDAINQLKYAVELFRNFIQNYMISEIPSATLIIDQLKGLKNTQSETKSLDEEKRRKIETLSRLKSIQSYLDTITSEPAPNSANEKLMLEQSVKYNSLRSDISSDEDVNKIINKLDNLKERNKNMDNLLTSCKKERLTKGYAVFVSYPDYSTDKTNSYVGKYFGTENFTVGNTGGSEKDLFCGWPIEGGYPHGSFSRNSNVTYKNLPLVNGNDVLNGMFYNNDIRISCDYIYASTKANYLNLE